MAEMLFLSLRFEWHNRIMVRAKVDPRREEGHLPKFPNASGLLKARQKAMIDTDWRNNNEKFCLLRINE